MHLEKTPAALFGVYGQHGAGYLSQSEALAENVAYLDIDDEKHVHEIPAGGVNVRAVT